MGGCRKVGNGVGRKGAGRMAGCRKEWKRGREERSREGWKDVGKNGNGKGRKGAGKDGRM